MLENRFLLSGKIALSKKLVKTAMCAALAAGVISVPAYALETESEGTAIAEAEEPVKIHGDVECELQDGVYTIRIEALDTDDPDFYWTSQWGDKGDASLVQVLTETDMEDGLAYAGSFLGEDGADGEDTIRLAHTNGFYTDGYLDFDVRVEGGKIVEEVGGSEGYGATGEDLAPTLAGIWEEKDGNLVMKIDPSDDRGLEFVIFDGDKEDGQVAYYTMTAYYDTITETLIYQDGTENILSVTDESETEAEPGTGTGKFGIVLNGDQIAIAWLDNTFGYSGRGDFLKAE